MSRDWLAVAGAGALVLAGSVAVAVRAGLPRWEMRIFRAINGAPGWLYPLLWPFMQLGNLVVGAMAGLAVAWWAHQLDVAVGVLSAAALKLVVERVLRHELRGKVPSRLRPGTSEPGAVLRGDVPAKGASFPSGHIVLVAAVTCVVAPVLPSGWQLVPVGLTALVMVGRVYVGAHNPLDVTAGLGAGLVLGGVVAAIVS